MLPLAPPPLAFPTPASVTTASPALPTFASIVCVLVVLVRDLLVVVVVVVHLVPTVAAVASRTLTSRMWAGRVAITPMAALAECAKEAVLPSVDLCLRLRALLRILHLDDEDRVTLTLAVLPSFRVDVDAVNLIVALDDGCSGRTLPFEAHNLWCTPIKLVLGEYLLLLHLLRDVIVGNGAVARSGVAIFQDGLQDLLGKTYALDGALPQGHKMDFLSVATLRR